MEGKQLVALTEEKLQKWTELFKIIAHPIRIAIFFILYGSDILRGERHCMRHNEIQEVLGLSKESSLTYHLKKMVDSRFVEKLSMTDSPSSRPYPVYRTGKVGIQFLEDFGLKEPLKKYAEQRLLKA